jgi:hypothetical protein
LVHAVSWSVEIKDTRGRKRKGDQGKVYWRVLGHFHAGVPILKLTLGFFSEIATNEK